MKKEKRRGPDYVQAHTGHTSQSFSHGRTLSSNTPKGLRKGLPERFHLCIKADCKRISLKHRLIARRLCIDWWKCVSKYQVTSGVDVCVAK